MPAVEYRHDAYLAHASENASWVNELHRELVRRGFRIWFNSFIVGPSIRAQMETGLRTSEFGIVVLSPEFFAKQWTTNELDALFGLEGPDQIRILPVWLDVDQPTVQAASPMLAMRSASRVTSTEPDGVARVAQDLIVSMFHHATSQPWAMRMRDNITNGLPWVKTPMLLAESLATYDTDYLTDYTATELTHFPTVTSKPPGQPVPLLELLRAPSIYDGRRVTVIAKQPPRSVQVLEVLAGEHAMADAGYDVDRVSLAGYVFQLRSVDFTHELCYVHCIGPYDRGHPGMGPNAPTDDHLCWVTGLALAAGVMTNSDGKHCHALYMAASTVMFTPPTET